MKRKRIYIHIAVVSETGEITRHKFHTGIEARAFVAKVKQDGGRVIVGWGEE